MEVQMAQATAKNIMKLPARRASNEAFAKAFFDMEDELNRLRTMAQLSQLAANARNLDCMDFSIYELANLIEEFHDLWKGVNKTGKWAGMASAM
jgi:hypothetical protein